LELKRTVGAINQRVLSATSRYSETPDELVLELGEHGYRAIGSTSQARRLSETHTITRIITEADRPGGLTWKEILGLWPDDRDSPPKPGETKLKKILKDNSIGNMPIWIRSGAGTGKNNPFRFDIHRAKYQPDSEPDSALKGQGASARLADMNQAGATTHLSACPVETPIPDDYGIEPGAEQSARLATTGLPNQGTDGSHLNGFTGAYSDDGRVPF